MFDTVALMEKKPVFTDSMMLRKKEKDNRNMRKNYEESNKKLAKKIGESSSNYNNINLSYKILPIAKNNLDALSKACEEGNLEFALQEVKKAQTKDMLPEAINAQNNDNLQTPLHIAVIHQHVNIVKLLLSNTKDVDLELKDKIGRTALLYAARKGNVEIFKSLLKAGCLLSQSDDFGDTSLHYVVVHQHHAIMEMILDSKFDINAQNMYTTSSNLFFL